MLAGAKQPGHNGLFYTFFFHPLVVCLSFGICSRHEVDNLRWPVHPPIVFHPLIYTLFDNAILERVIFYSTFNLKVSLAH